MGKGKLQLDGHKLMYHVREVHKWLNGELVAPVYVEIGPTNACNHRCDFCAFDYLRDKNNSIDKDVLIKTLRDMADFGVKSIMFCGEGEPLLYPYLPVVTSKAKEFGLDIAITTNGVLLTEEKSKSLLKNISWIKVSIDAGTKENYARIHGTKEEDFLKLLDNLRFACEYKRENKLDCKIGGQMVVTDETVDEVEKLILQIKDIGLDYFVLKPYVKHPYSTNKKHITIEEYNSILSKLAKKYSRGNFNIIYRKQSFQEAEKEALDYDKCYGINFISLIDAKGNIIPCSVFYEKEDYIYGNIYKNSFREIWASKRKEEIMSKVYARGTGNCRNHCRLNFINQYLYTTKHRNKLHINFI